jgi:hypothetical protein
MIIIQKEMVKELENFRENDLEEKNYIPNVYRVYYLLANDNYY